MTRPTRARAEALIRKAVPGRILAGKALPGANATGSAEAAGSLARALQQPTYEVIPIKGVDEAVADLPREVRLTVTTSPAHGVDRTVEVAGRLSGMGFRVVPHLSARFVTDREHLAKITARLGEYDVREVFVIGGDRSEPLGEFGSAGALLDALAAEEAAFEEVGIAGYPESHPTIPDEALVAALREKHDHATYIASQLCFDADAIRAWSQRMRERGITLPIEVGLPGVAPVTKLMRISLKIGVGQSVRFLRSNRGLARALLGRPGTYRPDRLMAAIAPELADPGNPVRGFHIYTFNEVARTEEWRQHLLARLAPG